MRDDPKLDAGEGIPQQLFRAIQQSWCSIIVFSGTYALSSWCLEELAEIVKQKNEKGHKVFPIFYDVDPSDLRKQKEKVEEAFTKHEERYKEDKEKILRWRNALTQVANIKGWHLNNRHESVFIGDIVRKVSAKLCQTYPLFHDELVGISSRLEELYSKIEIGEDDIRIIGICGMGGIGKTTLARVVYDQMSSHFEGKSFIADVREISAKFGLISLQKQLLFQILSGEVFEFFTVHEGNAIISHRLSHKKVLVVIDDVDNLQHLKCLVGRHEWFGLGSRIIVTTRDEHLLQAYRVDDVYNPSTLNDYDALKLFNLKAFDSETVPDDAFIELSEHVAKYAGGLPLALEVLGSFLCDRDVAEWRSAILRLKKDSNREIIDRLRFSFDGLEETEKNIFLDIACFFNGDEKDFVMKVLDGCEFFSDIGIDVLIKKSLLTVNKNNTLWMHNLLQEMGRKIVWEKSIEEPGKRCRLWEEEDVYHVLMKNSATEVIEGMIIGNKREPNKVLNLNVDVILKMKKLRMLKVLCLTNCDGLKYLPNELRLLDWMGYPLKSLPPSFQPDNLVALLLQDSRIQQLWKGNIVFQRGKIESGPLMLHSLSGLSSLTELKLWNCNLREGDIPSDISCLYSLEKLELGSNNFISVPVFCTQLSRLQYLGLSNCRELKSLPSLAASIYLLANPSRVCNAVDWTRFSGLHCYRLVENIDALTLLKEHFKVVAYLRKSFDAVMPGSEIPKWFSHPTVDSSIKISLPNNILNDSQWIGVSFCCIFVNYDASRDEELACEAVIRHRNSGQAGFDGSVLRYRNPRRVRGGGWIFSKAYNQPIIKDHIYFCYMSRDRLYPFSSENKGGESETENSSTPDCSNQEFDELQFSITSDGRHRNVKVKKCGIRIVYQNDLEDINEDSAADGSIAIGPLIKRKRNMYQETDPRPQPKRMEKFFNFLMGQPGKKH